MFGKMSYSRPLKIPILPKNPPKSIYTHSVPPESIFILIEGEPPVEVVMDQEVMSPETYLR